MYCRKEHDKGGAHAAIGLLMEREKRNAETEKQLKRLEAERDELEGRYEVAVAQQKGLEPMAVQ